MKFCLITIEDAYKLLEFELANRQWFETYIEKREEKFYQLEAVEKQIVNFLDLYNKRLMYPALIKDNDGEILARTNLRINNSDDEEGIDTFGYRVAKLASGKGVATFATSQILKIAKEEFNLSQISAFVSVENPASARVLTKFGFTIVSLHPRMAEVGNRHLNCHEYRLKL